ncbi:OmpA family protein [Mucilaginibacter glaciei]|uniref:OmpA family protein n=1 Tax=Mucilaginibacter glaciei TaxID=2772109 RepID=A0A926NU53_9SPHI|nr:OmpA family protein [Mucilaginibacter glaciei]MBD1395328.1 OmpA family protein [Mucilaginibacter glaciei]
MKKIIFTILMLALLQGVNAQYSGKDDPKILGDKAFNNKDYYEAAFYYRKSAEGLSLITRQAIPYSAGSKSVTKGKPEDRAYICFKLGESYRLYENYLEAEPWYYRVMNENYEAKYPLSRLYYGICLRANQRFDEAIAQLSQFNMAYKGDAKYNALAVKEISNCRFAKEQYQYPILIDVAKRKGSWNSDGSDYALVQRDGNNYFTSSRFVKEDKKHLNRVYKISNERSADPAVIKFPGDDRISDLEYGTPSFSADGQRMYFTRWFKEGVKTTHYIYCSAYKDGSWLAPQKLNANVNAEGFNTIQPSVTRDGKRLYFTSNKPGGQGMYDIWYADLDSNGNPIGSTNLGKEINTPMDEQGAYFDIANNRLIYSSKGFLGLGGFDFFESVNDGSGWSTPRNMGYPMNSAKDDLYYMPDNKEANKFYISSDRESDCCLNLFEVYDRRHLLTGLVVDCDTHIALEGVKVSFVDSLSKQTVKTMVLGKTGRYSFDVTTRRPYGMVLEKDGYFTKILPAPPLGKTGSDTLFNPEICLQAFKVDKPITIKNVLYDYNKATLRPESKLVLNDLVTILKDNPGIKVELGSHTDSKGTQPYNHRLSYKRAQACVDYIISMGVADSRIYAKGYGETKPIAPNKLANGKDNPEGRQLNRRTEFTVLKLQ